MEGLVDVPWKVLMATRGGLIGIPWNAVLGDLGLISWQIKVEQNQSQSPHPYQALSKHLIFHNAFSNALFS